MLKSNIKIKIAEDFSRYPGLRYIRLGKYSGEQFREEILIPALEKNESIVVDLNGTKGYPPSFLEESFGGAIRKGYKITHEHLKLESEDETLKEEIWSYIGDAIKIAK